MSVLRARRRRRHRRPGHDAVLVLAGVGMTDLAYRVSQVALPLLVLLGTGSPASTGLVSGATGLPVLLSPWWARRLRPLVRDGPRIALCYLGEVVGLSTLAVWAAVHARSWLPLLAGGLVLGAAQALSGPARDALVADLGDAMVVPDRAMSLLTARELVRRLGMVAGPAIGGVVVTAGHAVALLWVEIATVLVSATLVLPVRGARPARQDDDVQRLWPTLRARPQILAGWVVRGSGCLLWFAFTLGLSLLGVDRGRPGAFLAVGMAAYGVGAVAGTLVTLPLLRRLPVLAAVAVAWALTGVAWLVMGVAAGRPDGLVVIGLAAAVSGVTISIGNAGVTAQITRGTTGHDRRLLLAGQSVVVTAAGSAGLLLGAPLLGRVGPTVALAGSGVALAVISLSVWGTVVAMGRGRPTTQVTRSRRTRGGFTPRATPDLSRARGRWHRGSRARPPSPPCRR